MNKTDLFRNIINKKSFLCVGLDTDLTKIPEFLKSDKAPLFKFNKAIIDATSDLVVCYKPNTAFYEANGIKGWETLEKTVNYIKEKHPDIFVIADAKRGDIGNTSKMYAKAFFENMNFDAITISPYMGKDSIEPFLTYPDKWIIILALTSNAGSEDFQQISSGSKKLFETVIKRSSQWGSVDNTMYVVGATKAEKLKEIRQLIPDHFLLIPGVGAQGGSLEEVAQFGINNQCGLLVNVSRSIIYASQDKVFDEAARQEALKIRNEMGKILKEKNLY